MGRLIVFTLIFAVFLVFITFNIENRCDVSFGFITFNEVPIFLSVFASFALGMIFSIPIGLSMKRKKRWGSKKSAVNAGKEGSISADPVNATHQAEHVNKEKSPYGID